MRDRFTVLLVAVAVLMADQASKAMLVNWLPLHGRYEVIDGLFSINHVQNYGAAFGLFANVSGGMLRWVLVVVSIAAVGLIWAYAREGFLDLHWGSYHWPSFNVADAAITVGAVILFLAMAQQSTLPQEADPLPDSAPNDHSI